MELDLQQCNAIMFKCALCKGYPDEPKMLSCNHTFCKQCLIKHMDKEGSTAFCECPTCQFQTKIPDTKAVESLKDNTLVMKAKQMCDESKSKFYCSLCDTDEAKEAIYICTECKPNCNWCSEHLKYHERIGSCDRGNLLTIQKYLETTVCNQGDEVPPGMCPKHKDERMKLACSKCKHPMCVLCQSLMECPNCGRMKDMKDVEELGESTKKLNSKLDELINGNENNSQEATELIKEFEVVQGKMNISFNETQKLIEDHHNTLLENAAQSVKCLKEQTAYETAKELTKVQERIDTLNRYKKDCEMARSKAAFASKATPLDVFRIFSAVKAQLEASCPKVKVGQPRVVSYVTPSDEELESDIRKLTGFFLQLQHNSFTTPRDVCGVYDAVYSEYRGSTFISCRGSGLYEAGAGGEEKVYERFSMGLCLSVCGKKLYSAGNDGEVHVFDLTEEPGELKPTQTITVPGGRSIYTVSVSTGGRVAVVDDDCVSVLSQDGEREVHMPRDSTVFRGSCPVSVQWVDEQSLCVVLDDDRVMLISLEPVYTIWTTKLNNSNQVSFAGGTLFVSHAGDDDYDDNRLTVLDERGGAVLGVITCPGEYALRVCTLHDGTVAALSCTPVNTRR